MALTIGALRRGNGLAEILLTATNHVLIKGFNDWFYGFVLEMFTVKVEITSWPSSAQWVVLTVGFHESGENTQVRMWIMEGNSGWTGGH